MKREAGVYLWHQSAAGSNIFAQKVARKVLDRRRPFYKKLAELRQRKCGCADRRSTHWIEEGIISVISVQMFAISPQSVARKVLDRRRPSQQLAERQLYIVNASVVVLIEEANRSGHLSVFQVQCCSQYLRRKSPGRCLNADALLQQLAERSSTSSTQVRLC